MIEQMTLRRVPDKVEKALRSKARKSGSSVNRTTIELLEQALGIRTEDSRKRDLSGLAGRWNAAEQRAFERSMRIFDRIDAEVWPQ